MANSNEFRVFEVNDAFLRYSFLTREEIAGRSFLEVRPPLDSEISDQDELLASLQSVLKRRVPHQMPVNRYQVPRAEGNGYSLRYFAPKNIPILTDDQKVAFILHTLEEVTFKANGRSALGLTPGQLEGLDYKSLFDQNPDAVFSMDRFGYFTTVNKAATELIGFNEMELTKMHFSQLTDVAELPRLQRHLEECLSGHPSSFEVPVFHRDGRKLEAAITIMPVVIDGEINGIYGIAKDITMTFALEKEKNLIAVITGTLSSNASMDESLRIVLAEICAYTGTAGGELWFPSLDDKELHLVMSHKKSGEMIVRETHFNNRYKSLVGRTWSQRRVHSINDLQSSSEYKRAEFARLNGFHSATSFPIVINEEVVAVLALYSSEAELSLAPLSPNILHHLGTHIQKKIAEQELNQYFLMSPDMICFLSKDGLFKKINPAFGRILGYSNEELLSRPYLEFVYPDDRPATLQEVERISHKSSSQIFENRYLTRNGEIRWLSWTSTFLVQQQIILAVARDITEQKKMQQLIELQERRFSRLFQEAPVSMCILKGKDQVFESANTQYYELTARTPEIIGKTVREVFPELARDGYYEWLDQVYETGKTSSWNETVLSVVTATGERKESYINFMYQPYLNYEGKTEGIFFFGVDVTQEVLARKKMKERKRQYIELIQNLPVAIYTTDTDGTVQLYNRAATELWGCKPDTDSRCWSTTVQLFHTDGRPMPFEESPMMSPPKRKSAPSAELIIKTAGKRYRTVMPFTIPSVGAENRRTGSINVLIDITERKVAEEELRKLSLVATKTDNIVVITNTSGAIEWVNEAFCTFLGLPEEEILGRKPSYIFYESNPHYQDIPPGSAVAFMENASLMTENFQGQLEYQKLNRQRVWLELSGQPLLDDRGQISHYFVIGTDITEQKRAYDRLKQSKNEIKSFARQLNTVLEEERARIAREFHDEFGQQLTGLKMSLSSLKKRLPADSGEIIEPMLIDVDDIIRHIRRFATELRPAILDTLGLIPALEWLVRDFEKKTNVPAVLALNVREDFRTDKNLSICCFRICQEALTNISKHSNATKVWVEITEGEELTLKITDNGKGMHREQISDPLSMGLLGMRERAHLAGGEVTITSGPRSHTTVQFSVKLIPSINYFTD